MKSLPLKLATSMVLAILLIRVAIATTGGGEDRILAIDLQKYPGVRMAIEMVQQPRSATIGKINKLIEDLSVQSGFIGSELRPRLYHLLSIDSQIDASADSQILEQRFPFITIINKYVRESGEKDPLYAQANRLLREQKPLSPNLEKFVKDLNGALGSLPSYSGVSFRGELLKDGKEQQYLNGKHLTRFEFTSTSLNPMIAMRFAGLASEGDEEPVIPANAVPVILIILGNSGKLVSYFSEYSQENEVLFRNNTSFEVKATLRDTQRKILYVLLQER